jgi:hypothetical protein
MSARPCACALLAPGPAAQEVGGSPPEGPTSNSTSPKPLAPSPKPQAPSPPGYWLPRGGRGRRVRRVHTGTGGRGAKPMPYYAYANCTSSTKSAQSLPSTATESTNRQTGTDLRPPNRTPRCTGNLPPRCLYQPPAAMDGRAEHP